MIRDLAQANDCTDLNIDKVIRNTLPRKILDFTMALPIVGRSSKKTKIHYNTVPRSGLCSDWKATWATWSPASLLLTIHH